MWNILIPHVLEITEKQRIVKAAHVSLDTISQNRTDRLYVKRHNRKWQRKQLHPGNSSDEQTNLQACTHTRTHFCIQTSVDSGWPNRLPTPQKSKEKIKIQTRLWLIVTITKEMRSQTWNRSVENWQKSFSTNTQNRHTMILYLLHLKSTPW